MKPLADSIYKELYSRMESSLITSLMRCLNNRTNYNINEKLFYELIRILNIRIERIIKDDL